jgi:uncharacterized protein
MAIFFTILFGISIGIVFGFALEKSNVIDPKIIIGQFQFRKFTMLKVFLSAIATGLVVFSIFFTLGWDRLIWKTTIFSYDIVGGLLLGVGVALAGACPGTVFAQIGAGYKDAWVTLMGALSGAIFYAKFKTQILHLFGSVWPNEKLTIDGLLNCPFWLVAFVFVLVIIVTLYFVEKYFPFSVKAK